MTTIDQAVYRKPLPVDERDRRRFPFLDSDFMPRVLKLDNRLRWVANVLAMACLLVAPFRGSAGMRAGCLVLSAIALAIASWPWRDVRKYWSASASVNGLVVAWLAVTFCWSMLDQSPFVAMGEWKRDVLTPALAYFVFNTLTRSRADLNRWFSVLAVGLLGLTILIFRDPQSRFDGNVQAAYGGVGALSTWLIIMAALWPLAGRRAEEGAAWHRLLASLIGVVILVCAYMTGNRIIWICFAFMLSVYVAGMALPSSPGRMRWRTVLVLLTGGVTLFASLAYFSSHMRFDNGAGQRVDVVETAVHDPRPQIWQESLAVMKKMPWYGLGFGIDALKPKLEARFENRGVAERYGHGHNLVLNYGLQMGYVGAGVMLLLIIGLLSVFVPFRGEGAWSRLVSICGAMLITGFFVRNMTDDFFHRHSALFFWSAIGMLMGARQFDEARSTRPT
jgi:O-antigen ligase